MYENSHKDKYLHDIKHLAMSNQDFEFECSTEKNKLITSEFMIKNAREDIVIYSNSDYINHLMYSCKLYHIKVKIILYTTSNIEKFENIIEKHKNISIFIVNDFSKNINNLFDDCNNHYFMVVDKKSYMFNVDEPSAYTLCNFNRPDIAKILLEIADKIIISSY